MDVPILSLGLPGLSIAHGMTPLHPGSNIDGRYLPWFADVLLANLITFTHRGALLAAEGGN